MLQSSCMAKKKDFLALTLGSTARAKVMRLLIFGGEKCLSVDEIAKRAQVAKHAARAECTYLAKLGVIKKCSRLEERPVKTKKRSASKRKAKKIRVAGFMLDAHCEFLKPLRVFVRDTSPMQPDGITSKLRLAGRLKCVVACGTLVGDDEPVGSIDLLVVGDNLNERKLQSALRLIESELGREVRYASFQTEEFRYRMNVYDKLIRDVLDYPHEVLLDRFGLE